MHYLREYRRLSGVGPSLMQEAMEDDPMLRLLSTAFSTKVRPPDLKFIRYRKAKHGVELEDQAERLGGILTSIESREADPHEVITYLKKHGAKPLTDEEQAESLGEAEDLTVGQAVQGTVQGLYDSRVQGAYCCPASGPGWHVLFVPTGKDDPKPRKVVAYNVSAIQGKPAGNLVKAAKRWAEKVRVGRERFLKKSSVSEADDSEQGGSDDAGWAARRHAIDFAGKSKGEIGQTILQQMGGVGRLRAMIGANAFMTHPDGLSFRFPNQKSSRGNYVKVTLTPDDLYDMEFSKIVKYQAKPVKRYSGLTFDQLIPVFQKQTGLRLHL